MKIFSVILFSWLACTALAGCAVSGGSEPQDLTCQPEQHVTLVFYDRSTSTTEHPARSTVHALFADSLRRLIAHTLRCQGDQIQMFLVHERTRGGAYRKVLVSDVAPEELSNLPRTKRHLAELRYRQQQERAQDEAYRTLMAFLDATEVPDRFRRHTDLVGTLEIASEMLPRAPEGARKSLYYMGDMFESMRGPNRRDFDRAPPRSREQAEEWAEQDARWIIEEMYVRPEHFTGVKVRVLLGRLANKDHASEVKFYWLQQFERIGFSPELVHYN